MEEFFAVFPFDGWHVDTFGEKGAFAYDGSPVDYIAGFRPYIDQASSFLHKPVVFNAVNTFGQERIALSKAEFVYSELWKDHETYASILEAAEQIHIANPADGVVFAAYLHRHDGDGSNKSSAAPLNKPAVLLTDAAIFASGAAHIELGDGRRKLSSEYFPADTHFSAPPDLYQALRHYYDFLTAYENYLRGDVSPEAAEIRIVDRKVSTLAVPNTIWTIARRADKTAVVHLRAFCEMV